MRRVLGSGRLIVVTIVIGVLAGIGATGFHFLADAFGEWLFAWVDSETASSRLPFVLLVPTIGLVASDGQTNVAFSSDTAATEEFWQLINRKPQMAAIFIEASFPNSMGKLAEVSGHLTPEGVAAELRKLTHNHLDVLAVHLKPSYRQILIEELNALGIPHLSAMEPGREYEW